MVPMRTNRELHSLQYIGADGDKRFLTGGRVTGCYFSIGSMKDAAALCIAEGFATGASIHEATGRPVAVAFNAGNLLPVAKALRAKHPDLSLIICADDDAGTGGNPGLTKATEAAQEVSGLLAVPDFGPDRKDGATDFNDLAAAQGPEAVRRCIEAAAPVAIIATGEITPLPERGEVGEAEPYRLDLLPAAIREAAGEVSRFCMVPAASPTVIGLSVLAAAIGKKAVIVERPGLEHYPALFWALIAYSGERKSPPFKKMTYPLEQWAEDQLTHFETLMREAKATNEVIDAQAAGLKTRAKKQGINLESMTRELAELEARRIQPPPFPSLFTTDTTEQRLFQKLHDRGGAYAVMSGEGRPVLDAIMGKYSGDNRTGDAIYLAGISGDTITRDRVGGDNGPEERVITQPCLNVCVMVQQGKYLEAASHPALRDSGALARIWPVWLPTMAGSRIERADDAGLNTDRLTGFNRMVRDVLNHQPEKNQAGHAIPHKAHLSPEAAAARREFHNAIEASMVEAGELADVRDIASKAVSQTCKLALVLHIAENHKRLNQAESTISLETWAVAQALGTWHLAEAVRVQRLADEDTSLEAARRVLRWIDRDGLTEITATMVAQHGPRPRPKASQVTPILDLLVDHGYLMARAAAGRRKPIYVVNPALNSQSSQNSRG